MCNAFVILLGCLGIVDGDDVELNNLHRQVEIILRVFFSLLSSVLSLLGYSDV